MSIMRLLVGVPAAIAVTFALFLGMRWLISAEMERPEIVEREPIQLTRAEREETVSDPGPPGPIEPDKDSLPDPPKPTPPKPWPVGDGGFEVPPTPSPDPSPVPVGMADREARPLIRIPPQFPPNARTSGHVILDLTIGTDGTVRQAVVVFSTHRVFERPARTAALQWRYEPAMKDGKPIESVTRTRIDFNLEG